MDMPEALADCLVLNTVAAARTLLRRYDALLKPYGVTVQQFALLATIRFYPGEPLAALAARVSLDRTSLLRGLGLLEGKGLVRRLPASGNQRLCALTEAGDALLDSLLAKWPAAQAGLMAGFSAGEAETYLKLSRHFSGMPKP